MKNGTKMGGKILHLHYIPYRVLKRMSCGSKYEDRKQKENKERERENTKKLYSKNSYSKSVHLCVFNAHILYKSLQGLTEVLSYFNALKERLH